MIRATAIIGIAIVNQLRVTGSAHCGRVINQMRTTAAYCRPLAGVPARGTENEGKGYGDPGEERRGEALLLVSTKPGIAAAASRDVKSLTVRAERYVRPLRQRHFPTGARSNFHFVPCFSQIPTRTRATGSRRKINPIVSSTRSIFPGDRSRSRWKKERKCPISFGEPRCPNLVSPWHGTKGDYRVNLGVFFV